MKICLTGFMGCGKSTVGSRLAGLLCCTFADLDCAVEQLCGMKIPEIFAVHGEKYFREKEAEALRDLLGRPGDTVIALGGGTVTSPDCRTEIKRHSICIYLRAATETLVRNLTTEAVPDEGVPAETAAGETAKRPLLKNCRNRTELTARIEEMLAARKDIYEDISDIIINTGGKSADTLAQEIAGHSGLRS